MWVLWSLLSAASSRRSSVSPQRSLICTSQSFKEATDIIDLYRRRMDSPGTFYSWSDRMKGFINGLERGTAGVDCWPTVYHTNRILLPCAVYIILGYNIGLVCGCLVYFSLFKTGVVYVITSGICMRCQYYVNNVSWRNNRRFCKSVIYLNSKEPAVTEMSSSYWFSSDPY
ncbi:hypothetical protein L2E82_24751 [Cichorium intybus]|uniref:Uncharacterized protein n=1 Tax=Cichorium intybus TaxID=13427 RepID=A0ACB9E1K5_CICIN|nr:hypothetical protein L2E82_24751 [Cichorium intybus]